MSIYTFSEAELRSRFIKNIGNRDDIDVYIEVPVFCRSVDLVIQEKQNAEIFAIEFKLHDWKRAIQQAQSVGLCLLKWSRPHMILQATNISLFGLMISMPLKLR